MIQNLEGVDIYHCPVFEVDSGGSLKFIKGFFYGKTPKHFKTIDDIYHVLNYCKRIIQDKDHSDITQYAAMVFINRVTKRLNRIEKEYRKILKKRQLKAEENLSKSINKPGRTYI